MSRPGSMWLALALLLAAASTATAQRERRFDDAPVPVRYVEGTVHGFLELRGPTGAVLAHGDVLQTVRDQDIHSRMVFHFPDSSVFEEVVTYTQQGVFSMQTYHLVQRGPAFERDLDATLSRSGEYVVKTKSHKDGSENQHTGTLELPPDVYNGMVITIAKNLVPRDTRTVHVVAFTPQPRIIGLELTPVGSERVTLGQHTETAAHYKVKPHLGTALRFFATLAGKAPPDSDVWIVVDDVPAFVRFEGPMYSGPVWQLRLTSPSLRPL